MDPLTLGASLLSGGAGGLSLDTSSRSATGPVQAGPVVVNVAGFGGRAAGSSDQAGTFPAAGGYDAGSGVDVGVHESWMLPAALLAGFALVALMLWRK